MSRENVELVQAALGEIARLMAVSTEDPERSLRDDYARITSLLDPDFELVPAASAVERRTLRGAEGFVTFLEGGRDAWRDARLEIEELIDLGERVLAIATFRARGRTSGAEIEQANVTVWTLREGRVAGVRVFFDRAEALEAVRASRNGP